MPMLQNTELTECWNAVTKFRCPNTSRPPWSGLPAFDTCLPYSVQ